MGLPYDPAILFLGIDPRETKHSHENLYVDVHSSPIYSSQKVETTQMSLTGTWMNKMWSIYIVGLLFIVLYIVFTYYSYIVLFSFKKNKEFPRTAITKVHSQVA